MTATDRAIELVRDAAEAASDKLADNIIAFDVSDQLIITDAFVLCSAPNDRQVRSIVDAIEERLRLAGAKPVRREGERDGRWVLLDYGEIVVHVQHEEERLYYSLERIWRDCPTIPLPETVTSGQRGAPREMLGGLAGGGVLDRSSASGNRSDLDGDGGLDLEVQLDPGGDLGG